MRTDTARGHLAAFVTILIWGTTFISTKVLLRVFTPIEILLIRFIVGYAALWCVRPRGLKVTDKKQEWIFAAAGLCGITLYYLLENIALTLTLASNVGVIISIAPFFTAMFAWLFLHDRRPGGRFFLGFLMAMAGIALLSFGKDASLQLNPIGDLLGVAAAVIGPEVMDKSGCAHLGIIQIPVPVLKANREKIKEIRQRLYQPEFAGLIVVDFSDVAQSCNVYDDYIQKAATVEEADFQYFGIGLCGDKKLVNKLTGSLSLLR